MRAAAVIVAAGKGVRFSKGVRKQYVPLAGKPLLRWALEAFERARWVGPVVVVGLAKDRAKLVSLIRRWKMRKVKGVVAGGATRQASVAAGLAAIPNGIPLVAVHDAARPFIDARIIDRVVQAAARTGAAIAAVKVRDTVKIASTSGYIKTTPSRDTVWLAQTPQVFDRKLLEKAHRILRSGRVLPATDDAQLVERLGVRVRLVPSSYRNWKITTRDDLQMARALMARAQS